MSKGVQQQEADIIQGLVPYHAQQDLVELGMNRPWLGDGSSISAMPGGRWSILP